jgi:hypothetical protein
MPAECKSAEEKTEMARKSWISWGINTCAVAAVFMHGAAGAQAYPQKPIHLVVGVPPGGTTDVVARLVGQ